MNVNKKLIIDIMMLLVNIILLVIVFLMFAGCSQKTVIQREEVKKLELNIKSPEAIKLDDITFYVITVENKDAVFADLQKNGDYVIFGITPKDYENMTLNVAKIKKYMIEQQTIIETYKNYYEPQVK